MKNSEKLLLIWLGLAIIIAMTVMIVFKTQFSIFTFIWIIGTFISVLKRKNAESIGFNRVKINLLVKMTLINLVVSLGLISLFEIISRTYETLIEIACSSEMPDPTFVWLNEFPGITGYLSMFLFSSFVTIFAEEIFFRGVLLNYFSKKLGIWQGNIIQSVLFSLIHIIIALLMTPLQGIILVLGYGFLIYGLLNGWTAYKTKSIWPGLITANINNLILVIIYMGL